MKKQSSKFAALILCAAMLISGCAKTEQSVTTGYTAGTYSASAAGKMGDVKVEVKVSDTSIEEIKIVESKETENLAQMVYDRIPAEIVEKQSLAIDTVAGATITSQAVLAAVEDALTQAGGDIEALKKAAETVRKEETLETDIVVIGSGLSGLSTAISALQNGAKVTLVEKQDALGSSFMTSFGNVMMAQVEEDKEFHKTESDDTLDDALARWDKMTNMGGDETITYPDYDRVDDIIIESGETIHWMEELGVPFAPSFTKEQRGADIVKVVTEGDEFGGTRLINTLTAQLNDLGATVLTGTTATELIEENGKVVGVKANSKEADYIIKADNVVMATGGFGGSEEYVKELIPEIVGVGYQFTGTGANQGQGITMGKAVGAAAYEDGWIIPSPGKLLPSKKLTDTNVDFMKFNGLSKLEGGNTDALMMVNKDGARFTNEAGAGVVVAADMLDGQQAPYYMLFDSSSADVTAILETGLATGDVIKAGSIDALAEAAGMNRLTETFANYQLMAANGEDSEFGKNPEMLKAYAEEGDYYLVRMVPDFVATMGGLKTNENYQAVSADGTAIEGLYAVGEVAHRFMYNRAHFGNASNSASLTMGRLVGEALAQQSK